MPQSTRVFRSLGLLASRGSSQRVRVLPPAAAANSKTTTRSAAANTPLSFSYNSGFSKDQIALLNGFVRANYPLMTAIFGDSAPEQSGKTILVVGDSDIAAAYQPLLKPNATDGGTIYFRYDSGESAQVNTFNFTRLVLRAFQGPNTFSYNYAAGDYVESYQGGLADAAALYVAYSAGGSRSDFDPSKLGTYVLPVYDFFNRPELGNAYIYPRSGADLVVSDFRAAMAQAAWLKVAVENPQFFARFNAAYYSRVPARTAVNPNDLRAIAASVVPTVEGLSFADWARRQFVLDTSVTTGQKLYAAVLPLPLAQSSDQRPAVNGFVEAFTTDSSGGESSSSGFGRVDAFDEKGVNINAALRELGAQTGNSSSPIRLPGLDFTDSSAPGHAFFFADFSSLGTPNRARVALKFRFKDAETSAFFPYLGGNGSASDINYYGVVTAGESGNLSINSNNGVSESAPVQRGAWSGAAKYVSGPRVITTVKVGASTFVRNTAWLTAGAAARGVGFVLEGGTSEAAFTLKTAAGASKIRMISLPLFPTLSDEAKILGVDPAALKLARYRPNLAPGTLQDGVLKFGIGGDRHELYPIISAPITPGRGYWLGVDGDFQRTVRGSEPSRNLPFEVPLPGGWNQIGVPFNRAFAPDAIQVRFGGFMPVSLSNAMANGLVAPGIWGWLPRGGYVRIDDGSGAKLEPFQGYFIFVRPRNGVSLRFDATVSAAPALTASGWSVPLTASTSATRDASNRFGTSNRLAAAKPPAAAPVVTLRFLSSGSAESDASGAGAASGWADSFLPEFERQAKWDFVVEGTKKGERVTLSWGDLKNVPAEVKIVLRDLQSGRLQILSSGGSSKWTSEGTPRTFSLQATRLARAQVKVETAPSRGAVVAVSLNIKAKGRLEIQNSGGDVVATLRSGEFAAGTTKFTWSGTQRDGKMAPSGRYRALWLPLLDGDRSASATFSKN